MSALILRTKRLDLLPTSLEHLRAELEAPARLGLLLDAEVPASWPPGLYDRDAMEHFLARLVEGGPAVAPWYGWYGVTRAEHGPRVLVVSAGYFGPPSDGLVEIGYSVVPEHRRLGYASEVVEALVARALSLGVQRVIAHADEANLASQAVLLRCGFVGVGSGSEPGHDRFERRASLAK